MHDDHHYFLQLFSGRSDRRFYLSDLIEPSLVTAALKFGVKPGFYDVQGDAPADDPLAHYEQIGVIVQPAHPCGKVVMAKRGPHAGKSVRHDRHADPGAADQDAAVDGPL